VADDDVVGRMVLAEALRSSGLDVIEAADGKAAAARAIETLPDVVVLDVVMPEMDGIEVCRTLRQHRAFADTPILILTGRDDDDALTRAFEVGVTDFTVKPIHPVLFVHRVRFMLRAGAMLADLQRSEEHLAEAQSIAQLGSWEWDPSTHSLIGSPEGLRLLGLEDQRVYHIDDLRRRLHAEDEPAVTLALNGTAHGGRMLDCECRLLVRDDVVRHVHLRAAPGRLSADGSTLVAGTILDITEHVAATEHIHRLSNYDSLSGLPNRSLFMHELDQVLSNAARRECKVAVIHLDINNLNRINETLGHAAGDAVLCETGARLRALVRFHDPLGTKNDGRIDGTVSHFSGDEFLLAFGDLESTEHAANIADRLLCAFANPFEWNGTELFFTASMGISMYPDDAIARDDLIQNAATALKHAKERGGTGRFQYFSRTMNEEAQRRFTMETHLRRAISSGEIDLYYQPQVNARTGAIIGVEGLLRWNSPELGEVSPAQFVPAAEKLGLIRELSDIAVMRACKHLGEWRRQMPVTPRIALNVSVHQTREPNWIAHMVDILEAHGARPGDIEVEITESAFLDARDYAESVFAQLKARGFRTALDDFGTGYSCFAYVSQFAFDTLKIDASFVRPLAGQGKNLAIVAAMVGMARSLGMEPLAEGVETEVQRNLLVAVGCSKQQGYLHGCAMPAHELAVRFAQPASALDSTT
jgi:diguanylate cyclase (GGDEF)-like protein